MDSKLLYGQDNRNNISSGTLENSKEMGQTRVAQAAELVYNLSSDELHMVKDFVLALKAVHIPEP